VAASYRITLEEVPGGGDDAPATRRLARVVKHAGRLGWRCVLVEEVPERLPEKETIVTAQEERFWIILERGAPPVLWPRSAVASWIRQNKLSPHRVQVCLWGGAWGVASDHGFEGEAPDEVAWPEDDPEGGSSDPPGASGAFVEVDQAPAGPPAAADAPAGQPDGEDRPLVPVDRSAEFLASLPTRALQFILAALAECWREGKNGDRPRWERHWQAYLGELARRGESAPPLDESTKEEEAAAALRAARAEARARARQAKEAAKAEARAARERVREEKAARKAAGAAGVVSDEPGGVETAVVGTICRPNEPLPEEGGP
jgi:hypothetical protein